MNSPHSPARDDISSVAKAAGFSLHAAQRLKRVFKIDI